MGLLLTRGQIIVLHNCLSMFYDAGTVNLEGREEGREGREGREGERRRERRREE